MKTLWIICIAAVILSLQSCEEKGVLINGKKDFVDITYTAAPETPQRRNVFIEEFTGASCPNCPSGHAAVAALIKDNPGRVVAVAYHTTNGGAFNPLNKEDGKSKYDFRDSAATHISATIYGGVNAIPKAGIDRVPLEGSLQVIQSQWSVLATSRLSVTPEANLYLTSSYDDKENKVNIHVKIAYTQDVSAKNILTIGVTESGILDAQEFYGYIDLNYEHNHIFRKCLTPFYGNSVLDSLATKEKGRVYEYYYIFTPDVIWNLDNCHIIAALSKFDTDNKSVLQAAEVKLK